MESGSVRLGGAFVVYLHEPTVPGGHRHTPRGFSPCGFLASRRFVPFYKVLYLIKLSWAIGPLLPGGGVQTFNSN